MPRPRQRTSMLALVIVLTVASAGCSRPVAVPPGPIMTAGTTVGPAPTVTTTTSQSSPGPTATLVPTQAVDGPPAARLAVDGGDPVTGQLGSYVWKDGGSDSPWLPGARIAVGAGETLAMTLDPDVAIGSWRARYVPASADGPGGAASLGEGRAAVAFTPPPGSWTVEVRVVFGGGRGDASYFWRVEVS